MASNKFPDNTKTLIYLIQHPISNEIKYVGKTVNFQKRKSQHLSSNDNTYCRNWIKKLQANKLTPKFIPFLSCLFKDSAELEQNFIKYFNTKKPNGCNLTDGGEGNLGHNHTIEVKNKLSKINKGKNLGRKHTDKVKQLLHDIRLGNKNPFYGKTHSQKHKETLRQTIRKMHETRRYPIKDQYGKIYNSVRECCVINNLDKSDVYRHLNGKKTHVKRFILTKV